MKQVLILLTLTVLSTACPYSYFFGGLQESNLQEDARFKLELQLTTNDASSTRENFWNFIEEDKYTTLPNLADFGLTGPISLAEFAFESMTVTIDRTEDTMPAGRTKWIHPLGVCGKVKFIANDYSKISFSGLFQGADFGIARLSLAKNPGTDDFIPGMALKFFRNNGQLSGNIISMFSLDGQGSNFNFFQNRFTNIVGEPSTLSLKAVALIFRRASSCPTVLALGDFARFNQDGQYKNYQFPNQIYFRPVAETQFSTANNRDFRNDLATLKAGQKLYDVYVSQTTNGQQVLAGSLVTESTFIASDFCDNKMFFKHQQGEDIDCGN